MSQQDIPLRDLWQRMIDRQDYSTLEEYDDAGLHATLVPEEREILARLMVLHGEKLLKDDYRLGSYYLERATDLVAHSRELHMLKGRAYSQLSTSPQALEAAAAAYAGAAALSPDHAAIWYQWAVAATQLGSLKGDIALLHDADKLMARAETIGAAAHSTDTFLSNLYWSWGQLWHSMARLSGEPCDLDGALRHYRKVATLGSMEAQFWNDYANALWEMGGYLRCPEVFHDVVTLYRKAIALNPRHYGAQFNLALCYHRYFEVMWKSSLFWHAHEQYTHCKVLNAQHGLLHGLWGRLLLLQGQLRRDSDLLDQACDQLERAKVLDGSNIQLELDLAEAYLWSASVYDDLVLLRQAEEMSKSLLAADTTSPEVWILAGYCSAESGNYFDEESYYHTAVQQFNRALKLDPRSAKAWYGKASATLALAELVGNPEFLTSAMSYFEQAHEFEGHFPPQFWNEWGVTAMKLAELSYDKAMLLQAIAKFEHAIESDLSISDGEHVDPEWLYNYGCGYDFLGDLTDDATSYEKSIIILHKVLEMDPDYLQARYNLAVAYAHLGEFVSDVEILQHGCDQFRELLAADGEEETAWNEWGLALINLALLLCEEAQHDLGDTYFLEAEEKLRCAASLGYNVAFYNLACLYSLRGDYQAALAHLERAEHSAALPPLEDVMQDAWLDGLRQTEQFHRLLSQLLSKDTIE